MVVVVVVVVVVAEVATRRNKHCGRFALDDFLLILFRWTVAPG